MGRAGRFVHFSHRPDQVDKCSTTDIGKGSRYPAQLNFGDCFAYALARATGEPLLFKGNDFQDTDIALAIG